MGRNWDDTLAGALGIRLERCQSLQDEMGRSCWAIFFAIIGPRCSGRQ
jgi:hypothetical protein